MGFHFSIGWGKNKGVQYKEDSANNHVYTLTNPDLGKFLSCFEGGYSAANMLKLFESIPEVYAPIDAIADRVTKGIWELVKEDTGDVVTDNKQWNKLKAQPNWKQSFTQFIYSAVVYKYVTGNRYFYKYIPDALPDKFEYIQALWLLPPQYTEAHVKEQRPTYFYTTDIKDLVDYYSINWGVESQKIDNPSLIYHDVFLDVSIENEDILKGISPLKAAKYPMSNLMAVYEARHAIYVKRGMLGIIVNKKTDASGSVALSPSEKKNVLQGLDNTYGITGDRNLYGVTDVPVDFVRLAMSIEELKPLEETFASAAAIAAILNVPRSLILTKEGPTHNNQFSDERKFYSDVIMPEADSIAAILTHFLGVSALKQKIRVRFDHVEALQEDKKLQAETQQIKSTTYTSLYEKGHITKNEMLVALGLPELRNGGDVYITDGKNPDPLAVKLGIGGTEALIQVLTNPNLPSAVKRNTLISVFGLDKEDAVKLTIENININQENQQPTSDGNQDNQDMQE